MNCPHCNCAIEFTCCRCGHTWTPRKSGIPTVCAGCKSPYWRQPRQQLTKIKDAKQARKQKN